MTLPNGSNTPPLSLSDINGEFGYGTNLNAYRGKIFGRDNSTAGVFSAGAIRVGDFYATKKVVAGGPFYPATGSIVIPPYKTITFYVVGGNGGQQGANGAYTGGGPLNGVITPGSNGSAGGATSFSSIISSAGGAVNGGTATPQTVTLTNPLLGGSGPTSGSIVAVTIGGGGAGGQGGPNYGWTGTGYVLGSYQPSGANGAAGSAYYSWTGEP